MNDLEVREYLGSSIQFKNINGEIYINATNFKEPQKLADWKRSSKTIELIKELEAMEISHRLIISENGKDTFIHESLVLDLAQYISVKFKIWCNTQIASLIRNGFVSLKQKTEEEMLLELFPSSDKNLIALTSENIREVKKLNLKIKEDAPKVSFADRITNSSDAIDMGNFAKVLSDENIKIGRNKFFDWLRANKYLMSNNIPYQKYIDNGYFTVIETVKKSVYGDKIFPKTLITGRGQLVIVEKLRLEVGEK